MNLAALIRPNLLELRPYSSARAEYSGEADVYLDANENPIPSEVNRYPDPAHTSLRKAISSRLGLSMDQIILGNGSDGTLRSIDRPRRSTQPGRPISQPRRQPPPPPVG